MSQEIIQVGIDLGTTNSEVAVFRNGKVEIVKNIYSDSYTPSVFGVDKATNKIVGKKAYEILYKTASEEDVANNKAEIKRLMGTSDKTEFPRLNKALTPEEISAEIIKSLREDIGRKYPDIDTRAAVITVPAYFSILQSEATKRAGELAGIEHVVLLQEPIAAAISFGFDSSENQNWLVYDLGGGTFDVAVISSRDGSLTVLESGGDNYLGGKNIDWAIVDEVILPAINNKYGLKDFTKANPKYQTAFAKLKYYAESAKVDLSQLDKSLIPVDFVIDGDQRIQLDIELTRGEFERIIEPLIKRTVVITKETIKNSGVAHEAINKIVLIGGPTQIPYLRKTIEESLKIKVDTTADCITAVANGACLYGLSQRLPAELGVPKSEKAGLVTFKLTYPTLTSETDEPVAGSIQDGPEGNYVLQIQSENGLYTSQRIPLKNGKFLESIAVEPNQTNQYWLYLFTEDGNPVPVEPESFVITHGLSVGGAPISHSIGIGLEKVLYGSVVGEGEFDIFFEKGSILPLKEQVRRYHTSKKISRGDDAALPIVVLEGEAENPENNYFVCGLGINAKDLPHDLPAGTDIDVAISVNEARELSVRYYIPSIDKSGDLRVTEFAEALDVERLSASIDRVQDAFSKVADLCTDEEREEIGNLFESANLSLQSAKVDEDDKRKADKEIKELRIKVEAISINKKGDKLRTDFENLVKFVPELISNAPEDANKEAGTEHYTSLKTEGEAAISDNNEKLLAQTNEKLVALAVRYYYASPQGWLEQLARHLQGEFKYTNPDAAKHFIENGEKALDKNDLDGVKEAVKELQNLMVDRSLVDINSMLSGLTK